MKRTKELNNKGFSLVEIIIVVAIMAVLLVIITPQYFKYIESSKEGTDEDTVRTVLTALQTEAALGKLATATLEFKDTGLTISETGGTTIETALKAVAIDPAQTKMQSAKYNGLTLTTAMSTTTGLPVFTLSDGTLAAALRINGPAVVPGS